MIQGNLVAGLWGGSELRGKGVVTSRLPCSLGLSRPGGPGACGVVWIGPVSPPRSSTRVEAGNVVQGGCEVR